MIEGTYTAPNGWVLSWRTFCEDDCQMYPRPVVCRENCQYEVGGLTLYNAEGQKRNILSGVILQTHIDRAVKKLNREALVEMQPALFEMEAVP